VENTLISWLHQGHWVKLKCSAKMNSMSLFISNCGTLPLKENGKLSFIAWALFSWVLFSFHSTSSEAKTEAKTRKSKVESANNTAPIQVNSDNLKVYDKEQKAIWTGHVVAKRGKVTLYCNTLLAFYDDAGTINRLEAQDKVKIVKTNSTATSKRAVFHPKTNSVVMTGSPVLVRKGNTLRGTRIIVALDTDEIDVENARVDFKMKKTKKRKKKRKLKN
jgi:lipopolysaccharide export system protein LptA